MKDAAMHAEMDKAWRQLVRWLIADVPNRVELTAEPEPDDPNGAVRLQVRVRDAKFQALDNADVRVTIEPVVFDPVPGATADGPLRLQAGPSLNEPGLYEATYVPRLTGGFKATASVTNATGGEAGWNTDLAAEEFRSLVPNVTLLERIAQKTGGEVIAAGKLDAFVRSLPARRTPFMEDWSSLLWHTPAWFALAAACLPAEWGLRRWKGVP